jgi:hypothetical protein
MLKPLSYSILYKYIKIIYIVLFFKISVKSVLHEGNETTKIIKFIINIDIYMSKTEKTRKGPSESATKFSVGFIKKGNDGKMWKIIATESGIHRWSKMQSASSVKTKQNTTVKISKKSAKVKPDMQLSDKGISMAELKKIGERNKIVTSGASKCGLALRIYKIRSFGLNITDLKKIIPLLPSKEKREAKQMLMKQNENPITDYKGMWKPAPKPLHQMSRKEMIKTIRQFRDAWEEETGRNQDLNDERLAKETDKNLREDLKWFYSETAKNMAGNWIRENM